MIYIYLFEICNQAGVSPDEGRTPHSDSSPNPPVNPRSFVLDYFFFFLVFVLDAFQLQNNRNPKPINLGGKLFLGHAKMPTISRFKQIC